ncbi:PREDICTED: uncharacterized protein LOC109590612 [Amphimedon queenslandica]|nr:PREDICTED: uncharacterized protein LOC109590612 [Amphimedon queenslandica]|eukprot:XP_019862069.1 PREDICTED: uncharacterized protein LOC109590612 [Amphimedon queenslandica]
MPALLPIRDLSNINPYPSTTPLLLYFESAIPMGLFCAVIVHLLSHTKSPWKVVEESNFSNFFSLSRPGYLEGRLILVEQLDCIALYCKSANDYIPARDAVEEAVDVAMSKHKLSMCEKPKQGFYCPCGKGRHAAQVIWLIPQQRYILSCTIDEESQDIPNDCWKWLRKQKHDELQHLPEILDTKIASKVLLDKSEEIRNYFARDFSQIAEKLLQKEVITVSEKNSITDRNTGQSEYQRMDDLLKLVRDSVGVEASIFSIFVEILKEKGTLAAKKLAEGLTKRYDELSSDAILEPSSKRAKRCEQD